MPALAASCAIPYLFAPVKIDGVEYGDGGFVDRIGAQAWRQLRPDAQCVAHMVDRSNGAADEVGLDGVTVVRTPRSFASFWSMGPYAEQLAEAEDLVLGQLSRVESVLFVPNTFSLPPSSTSVPEPHQQSDQT